MNQLKRFSYLSLSLALLSCVAALGYRSQGRDAVRKLVGEVGHTHLYGMDDYYGTFDVMAEYTRTFNPNHIANALFRGSLPFGSPTVGSDSDACESRCIQIQGSRVANRNTSAWLADYFYLPNDFQGSFCVSPRITNGIINFDFYLGLDPWLCGSYFRIYGPVVWTKWELNFCESVLFTGTTDFMAGNFTPNVLPRTNLLANFGEYASGLAPASFDSVMFGGLKFAKLNGKNDETKLGFADLRFELGWNFGLGEDYYVGINLQGAAPTGSSVTACTLFDPIVGNGNHWELGAGFQAGYVFWHGCNGNVDAGIFIDGNITHLFGAHEQRTFDLCGKPNSKYMLASNLGPNNNILAGRTATGAGTTTPYVISNYQFANQYTPVANLTTVETKVDVGVQADIVAMFNYRYCNWSWDLGYNFWGQSCYKYSCDASRSCGTISLLDSEAGKGWVLKGDARNFGYVQGQTVAVALAPSESAATINSGTNAVAAAVTNVANPTRQNQGVDRALFAVAQGTGVQLTFLPNGPATGAQIKTSIQPTLLTVDDIGFDLSTRGISHKVFSHISYTWEECSDYLIPYLGVGGFAEFGKPEHRFNNRACEQSTNQVLQSGVCRSCIDFALSQWGVWAKGGVSF